MTTSPPRIPLRRRRAVVPAVAGAVAALVAIAVIAGRGDPDLLRVAAGGGTAAVGPAGHIRSVHAHRAGRTGGVPPYRFAWPIRPFDREHPLRATFGEPRALVGLGLDLVGAARAIALNHIDQIADVGRRGLHTGVDIATPDGTPVYAVTSGVAATGGAGYERHVTVGPFQYWHLAGAVPTGTRVVAFRTPIGTVFPGQGHVHLTRLDAAGRPVNPITDGGLTPYEDTAPPRIGRLEAYLPDGTRTGLAVIRGPVALALNAFDVQSFGGLETGLYRLDWTLTRVGAASPALGPVRVFRFDTLPAPQLGEDLYTNGSTRHITHPRFWYRLTTAAGGASGLLAGNLLHTEHLAPGAYLLEVTGADARGNETTRSYRLRVATAGPPRPA